MRVVKTACPTREMQPCPYADLCPRGRRKDRQSWRRRLTFFINTFLNINVHSMIEHESGPMSDSEIQSVIDYIIALEASAIEYAAKFGVSDTFSLALNRKPSDDVLARLKCRPRNSID